MERMWTRVIELETKGEGCQNVIHSYSGIKKTWIGYATIALDTNPTHGKKMCYVACDATKHVKQKWEIQRTFRQVSLCAILVWQLATLAPSNRMVFCCYYCCFGPVLCVCLCVCLDCFSFVGGEQLLQFPHFVYFIPHSTHIWICNVGHAFLYLSCSRLLLLPSFYPSTSVSLYQTRYHAIFSFSRAFHVFFYEHVCVYVCMSDFGSGMCVVWLWLPRAT